MKTIAAVAERTENAVTVRDILTSLHVFCSGQSAFNWARKFDADNVTVLVKSGRRSAAMTIRKVGDHYEGR